MKKMFIISLLLIGILSISLNVNADSATSAVPDTDNYSSMQSLYNSGIIQTTISGSQWITIYGKSDCDSNGSCAHSYADGITNHESALSKSVSCSNGEKYINYDSNVSSGKMDIYTDANNNTLTDATAYWSEVYYVTCTNTDSGIPSNPIEDGGNNGGGGTVNNPPTGVETYFLVLGAVSLVSYGFMISVKKFNLFKKI